MPAKGPSRGGPASGSPSPQPADPGSIKAIVYVIDGVVARVRAVEPDLSKWDTDDRGYADILVTAPLTDVQIARQLPTLGLALGDERPHVRGRIREFVSS